MAFTQQYNRIVGRRRSLKGESNGAGAIRYQEHVLVDNLAGFFDTFGDLIKYFGSVNIPVVLFGQNNFITVFTSNLALNSPLGFVTSAGRSKYGN